MGLFGRKTYLVNYTVVRNYTDQHYTNVVVSAHSLAHAARQLERKHFPWVVQIDSVEVLEQ